MKKATCDITSREHTLIMALGISMLAFLMLASIAGAVSSADITNSDSKNVFDFCKKSTI